jgi:hypothetical protein
MKNDKILEIEKIVAIGEEIEASYNFIIEGIRSLNNQKSAILSNHVVLQLLSSGFERLAKILLLLKEKHATGNYPTTERNTNYFSKYDNGHGINKMIDDLIAYAKTVELMREIPMVVDDIEYIQNDNKFRTFLNIISDFSKHQRYYYIDSIVKKERQKSNSFSEFKALIYSYSNSINTSEINHEEEERIILNLMIITIEKGTRAISRFFTHGLGDEGKRHYGDFSKFILLRDDELGKLKYLIPKIDPQKDYKPIKKNGLRFLKIKTLSKSKTVSSANFSKWPFIVDKVEVINFKNGKFCFVRIKNEVFALNGNALRHFKIPNYIASKYLKPRHTLPELLTIAKRLE